MNNIWILGVSSEPANTEETGTIQKTAADDPNSLAATERAPQSPYFMWISMGMIFVVFYFLMFRGPKKKQQQHNQMVKNLQKNDRIQTVGGIFGTIVDVKDDEITLKIDEANNTKVKISHNAVGRNLSKDKK
jgi:preprotein translocase subunit YajC